MCKGRGLLCPRAAAGRRDLLKACALGDGRRTGFPAVVTDFLPSVVAPPCSQAFSKTLLRPGNFLCSCLWGIEKERAVFPAEVTVWCLSAETRKVRSGGQPCRGAAGAPASECVCVRAHVHGQALAARAGTGLLPAAAACAGSLSEDVIPNTGDARAARVWGAND